MVRKVVLFNLISLDGYFSGPQGEIDWHHVDEEFNQFAIHQLEEVGVLLFGRTTYDLMASFWPTQQALENDPVVANKMNTLPKIVFSRTLSTVTWQNTRLVSTDATHEVRRLKQETGKGLFVFGSANLSASLIREGLIDEFRVMVNPVILGSGQALFQQIHQPLKLNLTKNVVFANGNVLLIYHPY